MENTERQKFDDAWRDAFTDAGQTPPASVWSALDSKLTRAEGDTMKRRVTLYQRLAAAAILFAFALGALATYYISNQSTNKNELAAKPTENPPLPPGGSVNEESQNLISESDSENLNSEITSSKDFFSQEGKHLEEGGEIGSKEKSSAERAAGQALSTQTRVAALENDFADPGDKNKSDKMSEARSAPKRKALSAFTSLAEIPSPEVTLSSEIRQVELVRKLPAMPASFMADSRKDKIAREDVWASIGASAGSYSPQTTTTADRSSLAFSRADGVLSNRTPSSNSSSRGSAYSVGVNVGKRLSDRWVLQGGVTYMNQAIDYNSNFTSIGADNMEAAYVAAYAAQDENSAQIAVTNPYQINSINEFVSVPVQAGYLLVNRKIGFQLNSGVATDIFLQNTLIDKSGQLDKYSKEAGANSPYRTVSWAALMGSEVSYKVGTHYRISVAPGLRYSMNSVLKSEGSSSNPLVWDIGFRFRYIFK